MAAHLSAVSFHLSFHLPLLRIAGAHWLDGPPDLSCKDSTRQHATDDPLLLCKQLRCLQEGTEQA
jgi:hypothetical protein